MSENLDSDSDLLKTDEINDIRTGNNTYNIEEAGQNELVGSEISCFPDNINFIPLYMNTIAHQKVLITNSGTTQEFVKAYLTGDEAFEIRKTDLAVPPGESVTLMVSFRPKVERIYRGVLKLEGRAKTEVPITGKCLPPPLDMTEQGDPAWNVISTRKSTTQISIYNRNLSNRFKVNVSTNCECFQVMENEIEIEPASYQEVIIAYDPRKNCVAVPKLICNCERANQVITRSFHVMDPKNCVILDFGVVAVGNTAKKSMRFETEEIRPIVKTPFSVSPSSRQDTFHFFFHPTYPGTFKEVVEFTDMDLELVGESIVMPFVIHPDTMKIENLIGENIRLEFEISPGTLTVAPHQTDISPFSTSFLMIHRSDHAVGTIIPILTVIYLRKDGKRVISRFELPENSEKPKIESPIKWHSKDLDERTEVKDIPIPEGHSDDDVYDYDVNSEKEWSDNEGASFRIHNHPISEPHRKENSKPMLLASHPSFLGFFQMDRMQTCSFIVTGCDDFELEGPIWCDFPSEIEVDTPINVRCKPPRQPVTGALITIEASGSAPLSIPVIAYRGSSEISCANRVPLTWAMDDHYVVQMEIRNIGNRTGFVVLTAAEGCKYNVRVHPVASVIRPNSREVFEFIVDSPQAYGMKVPITLYWGDEVMRQIKASLNPDDFFAEIMKSAPTKNEIDVIEGYLQYLNPKEFAKRFKQSIQMKQIEMYSPEKTLSTRLAVSPPKLDFFNNETNTLSIINMSAYSMAVQLFCSEATVIVKPEYSVVKPYSELRVSVQMLGKLSTTIEVRSEDGVVTVPIHIVKDLPRHPLKNICKKYFKIDQKIIDFGICEVGGTRKINAIITNLCDDVITLRIRSRSRSWKMNEPVFNVPSSIRLGRFAKTSFIIEFNPQMEFDFEETFVIEYKDQSRLFKVTGRAVGKQKKQYIGTDSQSLEFPRCAIGRLKRGSLRINNFTDKTATVTARTDYPFVCPISSCTVDPSCYVLFPIHFSPKLPGEFTSGVKFKSNVSPSFTVRLRGIAVADE